MQSDTEYAESIGRKSNSSDNRKEHIVAPLFVLTLLGIPETNTHGPASIRNRLKKKNKEKKNQRALRPQCGDENVSKHRIGWALYHCVVRSSTKIRGADIRDDHARRLIQFVCSSANIFARFFRTIEISFLLRYQKYPRRSDDVRRTGLCKTQTHTHIDRANNSSNQRRQHHDWSRGSDQFFFTLHLHNSLKSTLVGLSCPITCPHEHNINNCTQNHRFRTLNDKQHMDILRISQYFLLRMYFLIFNRCRWCWFAAVVKPTTQHPCNQFIRRDQPRTTQLTKRIQMCHTQQSKWYRREMIFGFHFIWWPLKSVKQIQSKYAQRTINTSNDIHIFRLIEW